MSSMQSTAMLGFQKPVSRMVSSFEPPRGMCAISYFHRASRCVLMIQRLHASTGRVAATGEDVCITSGIQSTRRA